MAAKLLDCSTLMTGTYSTGGSAFAGGRVAPLRGLDDESSERRSGKETSPLGEQLEQERVLTQNFVVAAGTSSGEAYWIFYRLLDLESVLLSFLLNHRD